MDFYSNGATLHPRKLPNKLLHSSVATRTRPPTILRIFSQVPSLSFGVCYESVACNVPTQQIIACCSDPRTERVLTCCCHLMNPDNLECLCNCPLGGKLILQCVECLSLGVEKCLKCMFQKPTSLN